MNKKIAFITLGCKVNLYDTEAMAELFTEKGYEVVDFEEYADVYLINTCTVTNLGDKKSRQMIRRAKRINPNSVVVATGCYAQVASEEVAKIEGINIVIGTKNRSEIVETVENYVAENGVVNNVSDIMGEKEFEPLQISRLTNRTRAYIKIQEGCNRYCTYCIIPYARGPIRSRKPEEVIEEVKKLAENGFKEVVLTGIHVASYGLDLGNITLADIIEKVHSVNGIERIRFSSMEPLAIDDDFVARMAKLPKVCDHYHLSLQSGCNRTLKRMNRKYNAEQYAEACERLRNAFPNVAITTDIIVGFPDETEEDFKESLAFAKKMKLDKIHTFPYSPKKGTPAAKMKNQISGDVKSQRSKEMIALSDKMNIDFLNNNIGKTVPVLFEDMENGFWQGHTTNYIKVLVKSDENLNNKIVDVKLDKIHGVEIVEGTVVK
ncbi:MAG: tRNA (N(6)-L-threonylcarbamoyladenosine(37)-C(2))-methylthiotransferase MtaB [Lachnospirales bacterium]|nr:tRNA (N(6)-L-threonylcarbamoyladenosine(37)-C(2))-methylthiotransferase MtaB [Clostridia bacterium]